MAWPARWAILGGDRELSNGPRAITESGGWSDQENKHPPSPGGARWCGALRSVVLVAVTLGSLGGLPLGLGRVVGSSTVSLLRLVGCVGLAVVRQMLQGVQQAGSLGVLDAVGQNPLDRIVEPGRLALVLAAAIAFLGHTGGFHAGLHTVGRGAGTRLGLLVGVLAVVRLLVVRGAVVARRLVVRGAVVARRLLVRGAVVRLLLVGGAIVARRLLVRGAVVRLLLVGPFLDV